MKVTSLALPEVLLIEPRVVSDARGRFVESWQQERYAEAGIPGPFVQDNVSVSRRHVLRGLHAQHPHGQGKLLSVAAGRVFDVAVDIRVGSPRFGQWAGHVLDAEQGQQLYIPPGFAHGFLVLSEEAVFTYKCTVAYHHASEFAIRWNDPTLAIAWPVDAPLLSIKDAEAPLLGELSDSRLPAYAA